MKFLLVLLSVMSLEMAYSQTGAMTGSSANPNATGSVINNGSMGAATGSTGLPPSNSTINGDMRNKRNGSSTSAPATNQATVNSCSSYTGQAYANCMNSNKTVK